MLKAKKNMFLIRDLKSLALSWSNPSWTKILSFIEILFPAAKRMSVEKVMIPIPPS